MVEFLIAVPIILLMLVWLFSIVASAQKMADAEVQATRNQLYKDYKAGRISQGELVQGLNKYRRM